MTYYSTEINTIFTIIISMIFFFFETVQANEIAASAWMDNKVVTAMYSRYGPSESTTVLRRQKDGTRNSVPCPVAIAAYNNYMGGVDRGDQLRGYYATKRNFINTS